MAFNTCSRVLKWKEFSSLLLQNSKYKAPVRLSAPASVTIKNIFANSQTSYSTIQQQYFVKHSLNKDLNSCRFYSAKSLEKDVEDYRNEHNVTIIGDDIPNPYLNIDNCDFPPYIKEFLKEQGFTVPTVIQSHGWPIASSGKNFVGIAQTGTGKTLAYLLPAVVHLKEKDSKRGRGPRALILAPTRELARQIEQVAKQFERKFGLRSVCIYGGASRVMQANQLERGVDIVIATPGRLNDFLMSKTTTLSRCTYIVLDEADRMLDMGFEPQIRQALEGVPLERQILMFSATWPKEVQHLARDYLGEFVQVNVGSTDLTANHNIEQHVHVVDEHEKLNKFKNIMHDIASEGFGKLLVFTNTKRFVDNLAQAMNTNGWQAQGIHGDKSQNQRDYIINRFKKSRSSILVATDVAARGLDVDGITHVINYDFPNTSEDYIHRIGRTGRQNNKGVSHTILTFEDGRQAKNLIAVLREANQNVPKELEELARTYRHDKAMESEFKSKSRNFSSKRPYNTNKKWNNNRNWGSNNNNYRSVRSDSMY